MPLTNGTPESIQTAYVNQFRTGFADAYQQWRSNLLPYVEMERQASEFEYYDRIGIAEEMTEDVTRYGDNPVSEIEFDRRRIHLRDYELGKYIDPKDLIRVATDPKNAISRAMQASGYRKIDDIIIETYFGKAYTGKKGATEIDWVGNEANAKDAAGDDVISVGEYSKGHTNPITTAGLFQLIAGNYEGIHIGVQYDASGSGTTDKGISLEKLKAVRQTMMRLDALRQEETLTCFLPASGFNQLLGIDAVINSDYSTRKNLAEGNVTTFLGFRFVHAENLPKDAEGNTRVMVFKPAALKLAIGKALTADMWLDTARKKIPYLYFKQSLGGSRMWGEVAAEIACAM